MTQIFTSDLIKLEKTMNKELQKLYLWLNINRLSLNVTKTNFIIFHPYNKPLKQHITLKNLFCIPLWRISMYFVLLMFM